MYSSSPRQIRDQPLGQGSFLQPGLSIKPLIPNLDRVVFEEIEKVWKNGLKTEKLTIPKCIALPLDKLGTSRLCRGGSYNLVYRLNP